MEDNKNLKYFTNNTGGRGKIVCKLNDYEAARISCGVKLWPDMIPGAREGVCVLLGGRVWLGWFCVLDGVQLHAVCAVGPEAVFWVDLARDHSHV